MMVQCDVGCAMATRMRLALLARLPHMTHMG